MDLQAQDRCHRIGQMREVNIYRLVTEHTIEENIWKKSQQKRHMNQLVIGDGQFDTAFLDKLDPRELLGVNQQGERTDGKAEERKEKPRVEAVVQQEEDAVEEEEEEEPASLSRVTGKKDEYSAEEVQALMMNLEDESDRTALINVQAELEAERAEFGGASTSSPTSSSPLLPHHPARSSRPSTSSVYAKLSGPHSASFESALTPIQRYALFFAEHVDPVVTEKQIVRTVRLMEKEESKWEAQQQGGLARSTPSPPPPPPPPPSQHADIMDWGKEEKEEFKAGAPPPPVVKTEPGLLLPPISASLPLNEYGNRETLTLTHLTSHPHPLPPSSSTLSVPFTDSAPPSSQPPSSPSPPPSAAVPARSYKRKRVMFEDAEVLQYVDAFVNDPHYNDPHPTPALPLPPFDVPLPLPSTSSSAGDDGEQSDPFFYDYALNLTEFSRRFHPFPPTSSPHPLHDELLLRRMHDSTLSSLQPLYEQRGYMFDTELYDALHLAVDDDPYLDTALPPLQAEDDELPAIPFVTPADLSRMLGRYAEAMSFSFRAGVQSNRGKVRSQYAQYRVARRQLKEKRKERAGVWNAWMHRRDVQLAHAYEVHAPHTAAMYAAREKARQVIEMEVDKDGDPWVLRIPRSRLRGYHRSTYTTHNAHKGGGEGGSASSSSSSSSATLLPPFPPSQPPPRAFAIP